MEALLSRLAGVVVRRRKLVAALWLVLIVAAAPFALRQADRLSGGGWRADGSESVRAEAALRHFPKQSGASLAILVTGASPEAVQTRLRRVRTVVANQPKLNPHRVLPLAAGTAAMLPLSVSGSLSGAVDVATNLRNDIVQSSRTTSTRVIGLPALWSNFEEVSKQQLTHAELLGFPLIVLILVAAFGTLIAALAPPALGFASVIITGALIYVLASLFEMSIYVENMASMIGIGVAVDYSLFIVSHFRRELREGAPVEAALRSALSSAGTAVVFSGATVALSLAGLFLIPVNAVRSMAIGAIVVVCVSVIASVTLMPAVLALAGTNVERFRVRLPWSTGSEAGESSFWRRWTNGVLAHPVRGIIAGAAVLLTLAVPLLSLATAQSALAQLPANAEVRAATERAQALAGPGFASPVHVLATNPATLADARGRLPAVPGVRAVGPIVRSPDGRYSLADVVLSSEPESNASHDTISRIQAVGRSATAAHGGVVLVGGDGKNQLDSQRAIVGGLWKILLFILGVSYLVLLLLLRSVLLPLKAVCMNLLSVGAAYGVLVAVFQWGWLDWTGYHSPGYIDVIVPPLVLAITFGLSMDYEVFLLTRIRERHLATGSNEQAVADGVVASARTISSAALIMVAVFSAFAIAGSVVLKELGVGLAVAILLDATLVRLVIVPATMRLLGEWNWWLPFRPAAQPIRPPLGGPSPLSGE